MLSMLKCDFCSNNAVFTRRARSIITISRSHERYCSSCFTENVEKRVFANIEQHSMIRPGDHLLLCVSGEKDSTVMFHLVHKFVSQRGVAVELFVLNVNEGISDYRDRCQALVQCHAEKRGATFVGRRFADTHGITLDEIYHNRRPDDYRMCNYCCSLRGKTVRQTCEALKANAMATGMTLNDGVEHAIMCLMKGSFDSLSLPVYSPPDRDLRIISPIFNLTGLECGLYAYLNHIEVLNEDCLYCSEHLRDDISDSLNLLEDRNPGVLERLYHGYKVLAAQVPPKTQKLNQER